MRWHEDKWIGEFDWRKFVDDNKEHFPLIYAACQKHGYFMFYSWSIMVRIYKNQEIDHPVGIAIYDERAKKDVHIYVINAYNVSEVNNDENRYLLKSFLEKSNKVEVDCCSTDEVEFYAKRSFKLQNECKLAWIRGGNGNPV